MKRSKFTEAQIVFAIRQSENGVKIEEICRKLGISEATFHNWKKKFGGPGITELKKLKQLEEDNHRLKQIIADLSMTIQLRQSTFRYQPKGRDDRPVRARIKEIAKTRVTYGEERIYKCSAKKGGQIIINV